MKLLTGAYDAFTPTERRNLWIYTIGIMFYKFSLETLNGCMSNLILGRLKVAPAATWATVVTINYATQSVGSLLVSPLIKRWPTSRVLSTSIFLFGMLVLIVPILEGVTGGGSTGLGDERNYKIGSWDVMLIAFLHPAVGIFHGIVELIRRVIPKDIVGGDVNKLKRMDSSVHIFYEIAGTSGALLSRYWISYFNYGYALGIIPIMFTGAALVWSRITNEAEKVAAANYVSKGFFGEIVSVFKSFFYSVWIGFKLVCFNRSLNWLLLAYTFPLVLHRYLENVLFSHYANFALSKGSYQQTLVAGSNFGELLGALFVLLYVDAVPTPIPWLRLDAVTLLFCWVLPLAQPFKDIELWVWFLFACAIPISFGWAAGDVSLVAYVQSRLAKVENDESSVSPLGSVMSFLYVAYIIVFAFVNTWVGQLQDSYIKDLLKQYGSARRFPPLAGLKATQEAMFWTAGIIVSISSVIVLISTFLPRGSWAWNPVEIESDDDLKVLAAQLHKEAPRKEGDENKAIIEDTFA